MDGALLLLPILYIDANPTSLFPLIFSGDIIDIPGNIPLDTPNKLFLETSLPTSASPYPSPSSAFYPPPIPASHEFANKLGAGLVGNKRYRGSGGSHHSAGGTSNTGGGANGVGSPISGNSGLAPSSANSSRRGSASAPSPLATHQPHIAHHQQQQLDAVVGSPSTWEDSSPSHDRIISGSNSGSGIDANTTIDPPSNPNPITDTSNQNADPTPNSNAIPASNAPSNSANSSTPTTSARPSTPTTSSNPLATTTPTSTYPSSITPASASKRTSQILESLTPIRAAPPSPGPSRRGSLIRRGSSRRWSRGSGALGGGSTGSASGGDSIGTNPLGVGSGIGGVGIGIGGMAGIGSAWFGGDATGGTSSTVSEDGSLHSPSGASPSEEPGSNTPNTAAASAASKRASRRLSAFAALASTAEGEVVSFNDLVANKDAYLSPSAPSPSVVETETEPVTPATPADAEATESKTEPANSNMETETTTIAPTPSEPAGFTALKPILVADFGFSPDDPRHSKRPLELLSRVERDALSPEERGAYARAGRKGGEEWEENAEEEGEDQWGWVGVTGLRPRRREDGSGGYEEDEGEEEMTPRFGYGYSHETSTPTGGSSNTQNSGAYDNGGMDGGGEGGGEGEFDPDSPLPPGIYRALYAFEAEGTAEMSLSEGQLVRVVGRGGGVGWAVVERSWRPENSGSAAPGGGEGERKREIEGGEGGEGKGATMDAGMGSEESSGALGLAGQALVPEGYLEIWMLDGEEWGARDVDDF